MFRLYWVRCKRTRPPTFYICSYYIHMYFAVVFRMKIVKRFKAIHFHLFIVQCKFPYLHLSTLQRNLYFSCQVLYCLTSSKNIFLVYKCGNVIHFRITDNGSCAELLLDTLGDEIVNTVDKKQRLVESIFLILS